MRREINLQVRCIHRRKSARMRKKELNDRATGRALSGQSIYRVHGGYTGGMKGKDLGTSCARANVLNIRRGRVVGE